MMKLHTYLHFNMLLLNRDLDKFLDRPDTDLHFNMLLLNPEKQLIFFLFGYIFTFQYASIKPYYFRR